MYKTIIDLTLIARERTAGAPSRVIESEVTQLEGESHMSEKIGDVGLKVGATVPGVFGDYSSFHVEITVLEKDADLTNGYEKALDKLNARLTPHLARLMDGALKKLGKAPLLTPGLNLKGK